MPPGGPVFCPDCGSKNKAGWEFCARCGATLKDAPAARPKTVSAPPRPEGSGLNVAGLLGGVAVVALTAGAWFFLKAQAAAPPPSPDLFAVPGREEARPAPAMETQSMSEEFRQGRERLVGGDVAGARAVLADAVAQNPDDPALRTLYGKALWADGEREAALEQFRAGAAGNPGLTLAYAKALDSMGRTEDALEQYRAAASHDPGDNEALKGLSTALLLAKRPAEAVEPLRRVVERAPNDILSAQQLGAALEGSGDLDGAAEAYRGVLARMPDAAISRGRLAEVLQQQGRGEEAVQLLREGLQSQPSSANLQRSLGAVLDRAGKQADAAAAFREFLRLAPNDPEAPRVQQRLAELGQKPAASAP